MRSRTESRKIGVLGANGTLGSDLVEYLSGANEVVDITKENYDSRKGGKFDVLVNANGNSRRFWANENPLEDFLASTLSVYKSLADFKFGKYVYVSSGDVYNNHGGPETTKENAAIDPAKLIPYGLHKFLAETIIRNSVKDWVILRSSMILGRNLKKGPFYDILHDAPLFTAADSRFQLITGEAVAAIVGAIAEKGISREIFNVGGHGALTIRDVAPYFKDKKISFRPDAEKQEYEMDVEKLARIYPLKTSEEYFKDFISGYKG